MTLVVHLRLAYRDCCDSSKSTVSNRKSRSRLSESFRTREEDASHTRRRHRSIAQYAKLWLKVERSEQWDHHYGSQYGKRGDIGCRFSNFHRHVRCQPDVGQNCPTVTPYLLLSFRFRRRYTILDRCRQAFSSTIGVSLQSGKWLLIYFLYIVCQWAVHVDFSQPNDIFVQILIHHKAFKRVAQYVSRQRHI